MNSGSGWFEEHPDPALGPGRKRLRAIVRPIKITGYNKSRDVQLVIAAIAQHNQLAVTRRGRRL
jgi:hypothetical protein